VGPVETFPEFGMLPAVFLLRYSACDVATCLFLGPKYLSLRRYLRVPQDIAVDGWALTMLSRENVGFASTCNTIGQTLGFFISQVGFLALYDADVCNKYFRWVVANSVGRDRGYGLENIALAKLAHSAVLSCPLFPPASGPNHRKSVWSRSPLSYNFGEWCFWRQRASCVFSSLRSKTEWTTRFWDSLILISRCAHLQRKLYSFHVSIYVRGYFSRPFTAALAVLEECIRCVLGLVRATFQQSL